MYSEIESVNSLEQFANQSNSKLTRLDIHGQSLDIFHDINGCIYCLQWKTKRGMAADETYLLTLYGDRYVYLPADKRKWMSAWDPIFRMHSGRVLLAAGQSIKKTLGVVASFPRYNGDYFFHFGHFHREVIGLLWLLYGASRKPGVQGQLRDYCSNCRYLAPTLQDFHINILDGLGVEHGNLVRREEIEDIIFEDAHKQISKVNFKGPVLIPSHDLSPVVIREDIIGKFGTLRVWDNGRPKAEEKVGRKKEIRGCLLTRAGLGRNKSKRWVNDTDILSLKHEIPTSNGNFFISFSMLEHEKLLPIERCEVISGFDFVVGSGSSAMYPSILFTDTLHIIMLPRRPTSKELATTSLRDFKVFGSQKVTLTFPEKASIEYNEDIWQTAFTIERSQAIRSIESIILNTRNTIVRCILRNGAITEVKQ